MNVTITRRAALGAASAALAAPAVRAQGTTYPSKPVRIVVPFPPGGLVDTLARSVSQSLAARLGQPFVVDNRAGAGGNIGADLVAKAAPDGYTLLASSMGPLAVNQFIYPSMPYDTNTAFAPITLLASTPKVICVANARPWRNLGALV
ncbi:MAG TPA: tripartite tricarboxylate transporter substrate-binding protein, partial [Roseomonas sp.]